MERRAFPREGVLEVRSSLLTAGILFTSWSRYALRAFQWARKYGLRVDLDLHTIPGSQNGKFLLFINNLFFAHHASRL
jgi:hypothetical protein